MARRSILARFGRSTAAVSAIEFAVIFPVLLVLVLAGGQLVLFVNATRKVQQVATSISEMLSQAVPKVTTDSTAKVTETDLNFSYDAALVIFPYVMADAAQRSISWRQALTVSFAGITFNRLSTACDGNQDQSPCFVAAVNWTSTGTSSASFRPCLPFQIPVDDSAAYSRNNLPRSLFGNGSIVAVDVTFTFNPTFGSAFLKPITITRSAFVQPRYVSRIDLDTNNGVATKCLI